MCLSPRPLFTHSHTLSPSPSCHSLEQKVKGLPFCLLKKVWWRSCSYKINTLQKSATSQTRRLSRAPRRSGSCPAPSAASVDTSVETPPLPVIRSPLTFPFPIHAPHDPTLIPSFLRESRSGCLVGKTWRTPFQGTPHGSLLAAVLEL